ncbi:Wars1 [Symbiodinium sp. CCMP2592]|nr:Wars1 [Symbiodinium sp. CCMP2592]
MAEGSPGYPEAEAKAKVKKPRPLPPPPPPSLATASILVRGAAARVLGLQPGPCGGELQPIWVSEPGCSKLTMSLEGSTRSPFPKDELHGPLLDALEAEANRLAAAGGAIAVWEMDRPEAEAKYGEAIYEPKSQRSDKLRLAHLPGAALLEIPNNWTLCATTTDCGKIEFLQKEVEAGSKKKPDTMIMAKKKQVIVKFGVQNPDAAAADMKGEAPSEEVAKALADNSVRVTVVGVDVPDATKEAAKASTAAAAPAEAETAEAGDMVVDPWSVKGKIDYEKLVRDFGSTKISPELLERIRKLTVGSGRVTDLHCWLRRSIFFSHRELDAICALQEKGMPFYLYTGRGPSSAAMHLGHLLPFMFTQWLQKAFNVPLVIQMTDDEKFLWKGEYDPDKGDNLDLYRRYTVENAKDIIACGFDKSKTFIFSDCEYVGHMYPNIVRTWKAITYNTAKSAFGFQGDSNIGQSAFPAVQAVPSFSSSFKVPLGDNERLPCLIPCAIDQDPYFRVTRDIAHKLVPKDHPLKGKPSLIHCKFFPPLTGADGKMAASDTNTAIQMHQAIFLTDTPDEIEKKIKQYAFSGGRQTAKEQKEKGADLDVDVSYQWLRFFLDDDAELRKIEEQYGSGKGEDYWNTGQVKSKLIEVLKVLVKRHQEIRAKITDEEVAEWMAVRKLDF